MMKFKSVVSLVLLLIVFSTFCVSVVAEENEITGYAVSIPEPGQMPSIISKTAQKDKAAIVLIQSIVSGTVVMPSFTIGYGEPTGDDTADVENIWFAPEEGVNAQIITTEVSSGVSGTGFVITPDGYIITNAHVMLVDQDPKQMLIESVANNYKSAFYQEMLKYYNIPPESKEKYTQIMVNKFMNYFLQYGQITDIATDYYVFSGVASSGENLQGRSWHGVLKKSGKVIEKIGGEYSWGRDIAILKVDKTNLPTVTLGDSSKAQVGDSVFVIGYPGIALEEFFTSESRLEPTVTQGVVSARRTLKSGIETIQTDAAINHGNSGGPVYNDRGEVIGIATFGAGAETGIEAIKFAMPINSATEYLNELNIVNKQSAVDTKYAEALNAFWSRDCYTAENKMREVLVLYPEHPYAYDYFRECERAILSNESVVTQPPATEQPKGPSFFGWVIVVIIIGIFGLGVYFFFKEIGIFGKKIISYFQRKK